MELYIGIMLIIANVIVFVLWQIFAPDLIDKTPPYKFTIKRVTRSGWWFVGVVSVVTIFVIWLYVHQYNQNRVEEEASATTGKIGPPKKAVKKKRITLDINESMSENEIKARTRLEEHINRMYNDTSYVVVKFGSNWIGIKKSDLSDGGYIVPITFGGTVPISVRRINNKILVSGSFRDLDDGKLVDIKDNEWSYGEKVIFWDRNYNDDSFEIIDRYGAMRFQIEFKEENLIYVSGLYKVSNRIYVASQVSGIYDYPLKHFRSIDDIVKFGDREIPLLFKYPSVEHLHIRANK